MSARVKKYEPGSPFNTLIDAVMWLKEGQYFWWINRPQHPIAVKQWPLAMIEVAIKSENLRRAAIRKEWTERNQ